MFFSHSAFFFYKSFYVQYSTNTKQDFHFHSGVLARTCIFYCDSYMCLQSAGSFTVLAFVLTTKNKPLDFVQMCIQMGPAQFKLTSWKKIAQKTHFRNNCAEYKTWEFGVLRTHISSVTHVCTCATPIRYSGTKKLWPEITFVLTQWTMRVFSCK